MDAVGDRMLDMDCAVNTSTYAWIIKDSFPLVVRSHVLHCTYRFLELRKGVSQKGGSEGGELVQGAAQRPQIAARVVGPVRPNLRAHVVWGANLR